MKNKFRRAMLITIFIILLFIFPYLAGYGTAWMIFNNFFDGRSFQLFVMGVGGCIVGVIITWFVVTTDD